MVVVYRRREGALRVVNRRREGELSAGVDHPFERLCL